MEQARGCPAPRAPGEEGQAHRCPGAPGVLIPEQDPHTKARGSSERRSPNDALLDTKEAAARWWKRWPRDLSRHQRPRRGTASCFILYQQTTGGSTEGQDWHKPATETPGPALGRPDPEAGCSDGTQALLVRAAA